MRHLLTESVLLSAAGGAIGVVLAGWTLALIASLDLPVAVDVSIDFRVLAFAVILSIVTGVGFGLVPALATTRVDLVPALRDDAETRSSDRRRFRLQNALVVFQVAISVALLGGTGVFWQMLGASQARPSGFAVDGIALLQTDMRYGGYSADAGQTALETVRRRIAAIPGVRAAVLARGLPMEVTGVDIRTDRDAVGRSFRRDQDTGPAYEVVGVVRNTGAADPNGDLVDGTPQLFFRSFLQSDGAADTVIARSAADAGTLVGAMERELRAENPALPVIAAKTMAQYRDESLLVPKAAMTMFGGLGLLGLALAAIGLYALVAFGVARRSREVGIRMALGARSAQVVWTVTRDVAILLAIGTALGLLLSSAAILALRAAAAPAPGVSLYRPVVDPIALIAIAAFMSAVGVAAASLPAWRAATIDPMRALRRD